MTKEDRDFLQKLGENAGDAQYHKYSIEWMDSVLRQYFGITFEEAKGVGLEDMIYNPDGACYYHAHGDLREGMMVLSAGEIKADGTIVLHYQNPSLFYPEDPQNMTIVLATVEEGYRIVSNTVDR